MAQNNLQRTSTVLRGCKKKNCKEKMVKDGVTMKILCGCPGREGLDHGEGEPGRCQTMEVVDH